MTQADLFEKFTRRGDSIVPPTAEEIARIRRDDGIQRAADHADEVDPTWRERALGYVKLYVVAHSAPFLAEDVRAEAEKDGLSPPPTKRAWGPVLQKAAREGIVKRVGYAPANSSNRAPKCLWSAA